SLSKSFRETIAAYSKPERSRRRKMPVYLPARLTQRRESSAFARTAQKSRECFAQNENRKRIRLPPFAAGVEKGDSWVSRLDLWNSIAKRRHGARSTSACTTGTRSISRSPSSS